MVEARWSGSYPNLCRGEWTLKIGGNDVSSLIPKELRYDEMNTYGTYETWYFDDNAMEVFEDYEDGLDCDEWIEENKYWLDAIAEDYDTQVKIFKAINEQDWRSGSCGGCI